MDFKQIWTKARYEEFINYLKNLADLKYKEFHFKILNDNTVGFIGVQTPILREIAKNILKNDYNGFLRFNEHKFYEEKAIHSFIIRHAEFTYVELIQAIKDFVPHISNWALADITAKKFPQIIENKDIALKEILKFTRSNNPWEVRLGLVMSLSMYISKKYIYKILEVCKSINSEHRCCIENEIPYYVKIGNAWLVSECYIKFPKITKNFLETKILEKWVQNKAVQKIKESFRVAKKDKIVLENLKI
ncbi:MAG: DNA alkylation repair protein [Candidatus Paraimprobicoccus trichonymphae]|uniref:DNA alkylation repair protein n=1 Tax=Candidatus Paraimprobicoccus trichonymphae TaxID=3033793 RepID=A0AA48I0L6_9FIRM|nr:MAG: DNA alkylation repair protein [Candidatus Paraimprobicoccus trichonymphae]